jgi:hypothetical protein
MLREVVAPAGIHTPQGVYLPRGSHVAMHTRLMQRSEWSGEGQDWGEYRPFRYCEMAAEAGEMHGGDDEEKAVAATSKGQISAVQISERYLPFGLGRHAWWVMKIPVVWHVDDHVVYMYWQICANSPGRFFAVSTLKLMLAYLVLNFDMKPFPEDRQPEWLEFGGVSLLKEDTYVTMKKRTEVDGATWHFAPES